MAPYIHNKGFSIIETIISMSIASILLVVFTGLTISAVDMGRTNASQFRASMYLRELNEIAKDLEQSNWDLLASATSSCAAPSICHPEVSGNAWTVSAGSETLDGVYTRSLTVEPVYRDQLTFPNSIVPIGIFDPDTKKVIGTITWDGNSMTLETYIYDL